ncbi:unnamed protein product [Mytilus edulis]|uniref:Uncharacterized protein n=1 Tax=Mytilus edulis TaxID=6550 RepID=A0A8S3R0P3_MYTED|nr:unnamed protein product [Mytilus edulis]
MDNVKAQKEVSKNKTTIVSSSIQTKESQLAPQQKKSNKGKISSYMANNPSIINSSLLTYPICNKRCTNNCEAVGCDKLVYKNNKYKLNGQSCGEETQSRNEDTILVRQSNLQKGFTKGERPCIVVLIITATHTSNHRTTWRTPRRHMIPVSISIIRQLAITRSSLG